MEFGLSVPFRTLLNLESEIAAIYRHDTHAAIEAAFSVLKQDKRLVDVRAISVIQNDFKSGLKHLSQDALPWFAKPIVVLELSELYFEEVLTEFIRNQSDALSTFFQTLALTGRIEVYDNTIAVGSFSGRCDLTLVPDHWQSDEFEESLSNLSEALVQPINNAFLQPALNRLSNDKDHWDRRPKLLRAAGNFKTFFDLNKHKFPEWNTIESSFFWGHRVYVIDDITRQADRVRSLLRLDEIEHNGKHDRDGSVFHVGSSIVGSKSALDAMFKASSLVQYFYTLLDILNANQNSLYRELSAAQTKSSVNKMVERYFRMENFVDYIFNEIIDARLSLQSVRKRYFEHLSTVFDMEDLIETLRARDRIVGARVERKSFDIAKTDRRILQFSLFLLGATQVISLFVDLFSYVGVDDQSLIPGILELFGWLDFNTTLHAVSVLIVMGALYASFRRE